MHSFWPGVDSHFSCGLTCLGKAEYAFPCCREGDDEYQQAGECRVCRYLERVMIPLLMISYAQVDVRWQFGVTASTR